MSKSISSTANPPGGIRPVALTIAGSDPSGGAGIQADLKTFHQFGVYGQAVLTLLTVQNTRSVARVQVMSPGLVTDQIQAVVGDIRPAAAKTGALGSAEMIAAVAAEAAKFDFPLVVDPVMVSKHGAPLLPASAHQALKTLLLPLCYLVTPNLYEAAELTGMEIEDAETMKEAAERIAGMGPKGVLVKGGHLTEEARDILFVDGVIHEYPSERIDTPHTHGTGCTFSAAITACLARGIALPAAVAVAKRYITEAIRTNPGLGRGQGPVNHFAPTGIDRIQS
ncbi:MAG: bifunctional hydroxymethylpyrimidine kinase/phosphomethylpyrimidine kinase [Bryobacterales bacterium]|nr:bifunctional hydroxymethylpyrimidine kinase/phosphomethylpyrimidine kinase [Bryobacterales bacterium]